MKNIFNADNHIKVAIYSRVSIFDERIALGIKIQERILIKSMQKINPPSTYFETTSFNDIYSEKDWTFVEYKKMMEKVINWEIDIVAVYELSRISRNLSNLTKFFEEIRKHNVKFFSYKEGITI